MSFSVLECPFFSIFLVFASLLTMDLSFCLLSILPNLCISIFLFIQVTILSSKAVVRNIFRSVFLLLMWVYSCTLRHSSLLLLRCLLLFPPFRKNINWGGVSTYPEVLRRPGKKICLPTRLEVSLFLLKEKGKIKTLLLLLKVVRDWWPDLTNVSIDILIQWRIRPLNLRKIHVLWW